MCNTMFPPKAEARNDILMQIAQQANLVLETFQDVQPRTVSTTTAKVAARLASMNKKRAAEGSNGVHGLYPPQKRQAVMNSTRFFHSSIAHLTRTTSKSPCETETQATSNTEPRKIAPPQIPSLKSTCTNPSDPIQPIQVTKNDVVIGNSKFMNDLVGNKRFRVWIDLHSKSFAKAPQEEDKLKIARSVVHTVQGCVPPGRFLALDAYTGSWNNVGYDAAVKAVMDVLRYETKTRPGAVQIKPISSPTSAASKRMTYASMAA